MPLTCNMGNSMGREMPMSPLQSLITVLATVNFCFAILSGLGKAAERLNPDLYESVFAHIVGLCLLAFLATWILFLLLGILQVAISECQPHPDINTNVKVSNLSLYCKSCKYQLIGITSRRCPECGRPFDPNDPSTFRESLQVNYWNRFLPYLWTWFVVSTIVFICLLVSLIRFLVP